MRIQLLIILIFTLFFSINVIAQKDPGKRKSHEITVNSTDAIIKIEVRSKQKKLSPKNNLIYYWYKSNKILATEGGFDGKPLHGKYTSFYFSQNLMEKGLFKNGLKKGEWKTWYENGKTEEIINWKSGIKHGKHVSYNFSGELVAEGNFKKGQLQGIVKSYDRGILLSERKYKKGKEVLPKAKKTKEEKTNKKDKPKKEKNAIPKADDNKKKFSFKEHLQKIKLKTAAKKSKKNPAKPAVKAKQNSI